MNDVVGNKKKKTFVGSNWIIPIFYLSFCFIPAFGQTWNEPQLLNAKYIGQERGLLQLNVKDLVQDNLGYLWAGTEDGLHRYNGYEFVSFLHDPQDSNSVTDDHIRCLLYLGDTLWMATNAGGISGFIPSEERFFYPFENEENPDYKVSYTIIQKGVQRILFSVKNNLIVYDRFSKSHEILHLPEGAKDSYVTDLTEIDNNNSWLSTTSLGIINLNSSNVLSKTGILLGKSIFSLIKKNNEIYIGTDAGLYVFNTNSNELNKLNLHYSIKDFYDKSDEQFYIGTDNGLFLYDLNNISITPIVFKTGENSLYEKLDINKIQGDKKGNLWLGTEGDGLIHYNAYQVKFNILKLKLEEYPLVKNISTFQILKGADSSLWLGSKYGVVKYSYKTKQFRLYNDKEPFLVYTMVEDDNKTIWAGGFTSGLLKYNKQTDEFERILASDLDLPDRDVIEIIPIDSTTLWVCTWAGGIHRFDINTQQFSEIEINGKRLNRARTSLKDSEGNIWLGTDQGAFKISQEAEIKSYNSRSNLHHKLSSDRIFSIVEDLAGNIWFGTNAGLTRLDIKSDSTFLYYKQKGLPNDFIYAVLTDPENNIWVSTNYGLSVLNTKTNGFKNYTVDDGLQNNEFNGKAGYKDLHGNFYFGGMSGINIFRPEDIFENPFLPDVYIESVELFNMPLKKAILFKDTLFFKSDENVLTFNYSGLNYLNAEKCNYTYMMEGFDQNWRPATKKRSTTYTNLLPGSYTFKVKASNDEGIWNENADKLTIIIVPKWYQTTEFKILLIILFLLSGIMFYFYKTWTFKNDKFKLEQIVNQRTVEISEKNTALNGAFEEAEKQRDNIVFLMKELRHRVKNNLQIISSLLNIQANKLESKSAKDALQMAKNRILAISQIENHMAVDSEIIQLDQFIREIVEKIINTLSDGNNLKFKLSYELDEISIKSEKSTMIGLILNELVTNTTKYAFKEYNPGNELNIMCKKGTRSVKLIISDNGVGYSDKNKSNANSMGIELVSDMVNQLGGTLLTDSANGTKNIIEFPI